MIRSRCTKCGASTVDGVLSHADSCTAVTPPTITTESRTPAIELTFDSKAEQQAFMDKLAGGSDLVASTPLGNLGVANPPKPMIRSEIEQILWENYTNSAFGESFDLKSAQTQLETLITKSNQELLDRVERELPEEATNRREFLMVADKGFTNEQIYTATKHRQAGFNKATNQTKATIDRIRGEL